MGQKNKLSTEEADALTALNQQQSPLLRLPAELRKTIFEYAFTNETVHFEFKPATSKHLEDARFYSTTTITSLTRVSRQIHTETLLLPYRLGLFVVNRESLKWIAKTMLPAQLEAIATLKLSSDMAVRELAFFRVAETQKFTGVTHVTAEFTPYIQRNLFSDAEVDIVYALEKRGIDVDFE
ncbi:hypothetical protein ACN47E_002907 [Coniothyrium glycines]